MKLRGWAQLALQIGADSETVWRRSRPARDECWSMTAAEPE